MPRNPRNVRVVLLAAARPCLTHQRAQRAQRLLDKAIALKKKLMDEDESINDMYSKGMVEGFKKE